MACQSPDISCGNGILIGYICDMAYRDAAFGRIYCSTFCPLGIYQDLCSRLPRMRRRVKPRWHYHYSLPHTSLRHISLFIVVLSIFLGISAVTSFFDPYSVFGRFGLNVVRPIWVRS